MRGATIVTVVLVSLATAALAESPPAPRQSQQSATQPQGRTGPLETKQQGGAPAASPQGETPPGMQSAPLGADKPVRTDSAGVPEGAPKR